MKILLGFTITLLLMISTPLAKASDSWTLYDDFNSKFLDIDNWTASEYTTGGVVILEGVREIEGHRLYVRTRTHGPTWDDGNLQRGDNRIIFPNPKADSILGIKASIKVNEIEVTQCPYDEQPTRAWARVQGYFFKEVDCSDPTVYQCQGSNNSVGAQIRIERVSNSQDPEGILRIVGIIFRCDDPNCFSTYVYYNETLGTIRVGQWATVSLEWNPGSNQFIFQLGKEQPQEFSYPYPGSIYPATGTFKAIGTISRFPYCSERQIALIGVDFDKVFTK